MGKFDFEIDPAFLRSLGKLSDVDKYAPQMIDAATPILYCTMYRRSLWAFISRR